MCGGIGNNIGDRPGDGMNNRGGQDSDKIQATQPSGLGRSSSGDPATLPRAVTIDTTSRLHFGLLSFGHSDRPQYGGVGLMVDRPGMTVHATRADGFEVMESGPLTERLRQFARTWQTVVQRPLPSCRLALLRAAPEHVGVGTGTQLGLAVATALFRMSGLELPAPADLAASVGRGQRSSIGTYGFLHGGLLVDRGKLPQEPLGPLEARVELPSEWRVVQFCATSLAGLSGTEERQAFANLPAVSDETTRVLRDLIDDRLLPAARSHAFEELSEAIYEYGVQAGTCFAPIQGGPFAHPDLAAWVEAFRERGIRGVGQSSWGPTLFALLETQAAAEDLRKWFERELGRASETRPPTRCTICRIDNRGHGELIET